MVAAVVEREGRYLITQRREQAVLSLMWEFPGGKVEAGEADEEALRRELKQKGIEYRVAKNTFILRALKEVGEYDINAKQLFGQTAVIFAADNAPTAPAKILRDFSAKSEKPRLKAAVVENVVYDGSKLKQIADFPTREEIIAGILASINAPISGIVGAINAVMRDVASLVEEVAKKKAA